MNKYILGLLLVVSINANAQMADGSFGNDGSTGTSSSNPTLTNAQGIAGSQTGVYNGVVSNPFAFCGAGRPGKRNPLRKVYDQICPAGNAKPVSSPVGVPNNKNAVQLPDTNDVKQSYQTNSTTQTTYDNLNQSFDNTQNQQMYNQYETEYTQKFKDNNRLTPYRK